MHDFATGEADLVDEAPQFDEDGRRYVFRYPPFAPQSYVIDRDRLFRYLRTHRLPGARIRSIIRDQRNAANFFEDVRDIQTHADVEPLIEKPREATKAPRLRSVS